MNKLSLKQAEKKFGIPVRKLSYLIRKDILEPIVENDIIYLAEEEINRYLGLPEPVRKKHHASYLKNLGPGLITGASDDDPSGLATYSSVGARYGLNLSWLALYLLPMMTAVQETCARIGIATDKGLAGAISKKFGKKVIFVLVILLLVANTINIGADIGAMAAALKLVIPGFNLFLGALLLTLFMIFLEIRFTYQKYARILKWLTASLLGYIVTGIIIKPNWYEIFRSLAIPKFEFTKDYIAAIVAVMGTTISPYLFFWQTSEEVEEEKEKEKSREALKKHHDLAIAYEMKKMRRDTFTGMAYANIVFLFIIITTAFVLHANGITKIETIEQAALALKPLFEGTLGSYAGLGAYFLFTLGVLGVGLLSVPVLAGSSAYALSELLKWHEGLSKRYSQAKGFYGIIIISMIIGLLMNLLGLNPVSALYFAAIINGITAPVLLYFIFKIGSDKEIMGKFTNPGMVKFWGWLAITLMGIAAILLLFLTFR